MRVSRAACVTRTAALVSMASAGTAKLLIHIDAVLLMMCRLRNPFMSVAAHCTAPVGARTNQARNFKKLEDTTSNRHDREVCEKDSTAVLMNFLVVQCLVR